MIIPYQKYETWFNLLYLRSRRSWIDECDLIEASFVQESKATGQQKEQKVAYMEAMWHGGQHWDYQGGEDNYGKTLQLSSYKSGASSLCLLALAWQVGAVHSIGERLQKEQEDWGGTWKEHCDL